MNKTELELKMSFITYNCMFDFCPILFKCLLDRTSSLKYLSFTILNRLEFLLFRYLAFAVS